MDLHHYYVYIHLILLMVSLLQSYDSCILSKLNNIGEDDNDDIGRLMIVSCIMTIVVVMLLMVGRCSLLPRGLSLHVASRNEASWCYKPGLIPTGRSDPRNFPLS